MECSQTPAAKQWSQCNRTAKFQQCRGTARSGYPAFGRLENYKAPGMFCRHTGVCLNCGGPGLR
jgi:hypothetical protein